MMLSTSFPQLDRPFTAYRAHRPMDVPYQLYTPYHTALFSGGHAPRLIHLETLAEMFDTTGILDPPPQLKHDELVAYAMAYLDIDDVDLLTDMPDHPMIAPNTVLVQFQCEDDRDLDDTQRTIVSDNAQEIIAMMHLVRGTISLPRQELPPSWINTDRIDDHVVPDRVSYAQLLIPQHMLQIALYATTTTRYNEALILPTPLDTAGPVTAQDIAAYALNPSTPQNHNTKRAPHHGT